MRKLRLTVMGAAMTTAAVVGLSPATAHADIIAQGGDPAPTATLISVNAGPGAATVAFTYTCTSVASPANHLFIAVKQGGTVDVEHTDSSKTHPDSFYSTNWKSDAGPNALVCDGVSHLQTAVLKTDSFWVANGGAGKPLHAGQALVQICLFDNMVGDPESDDSSAGLVFNYSMWNVHAGNGRG